MDKIINILNINKMVYDLPLLIYDNSILSVLIKEIKERKRVDLKYLKFENTLNEPIQVKLNKNITKNFIFNVYFCYSLTNNSFIHFKLIEIVEYEKNTYLIKNKYYLLDDKININYHYSLNKNLFYIKREFKQEVLDFLKNNRDCNDPYINSLFISSRFDLKNIKKQMNTIEIYIMKKIKDTKSRSKYKKQFDKLIKYFTADMTSFIPNTSLSYEISNTEFVIKYKTSLKNNLKQLINIMLNETVIGQIQDPNKFNIVDYFPVLK